MLPRNGYPLISPVTQELSQSSWAPRGDILDHAWYRHVLHPSGKPHMAAIAILGRVVYMYRPTINEVKNAEELVVGTEIRQKFVADAWQCSREALADMFGFGVREVDAALVLLDKELGVVKRERRTVVINGVRCSNVLYLCLNVSKLKEISTPITSERNSSPAGTEELPRPDGRAAAPKRKTNTKISQQSSPRSSSRSTPPAAVSSPAVPPPKNQTLSFEIEAAIQALPIEHQANARQICEVEEAADQVKLDAINLFKKRLAQGKAKDCGWLREAVKGDWGAKERVKEEQKAERQEQAEAAKRAEAERQNQEREADRRELLARQKRFYDLPEPTQRELEYLALRWSAERNRPDPDRHSLISLALDIYDGIIPP